MALELSGYSTPEKSYEQLYGLGEQAERRAYRKEQMQQREQARKASVGTFLNNYLDQKDYLTGTAYDPEIVNRLNEMLMQGADLATKGADASEIMLALGPKVGQLGEYSSKAKLIKAQKDKTLEHLKTYKGIDQDKFSAAFDDAAFFETDPTTGERKMKDISKIDPQKLYGDEVLNNADVFTNAGVADFVKGSGKETRKGTYKYYNKLGSLTESKGEYVAPPWMKAEMDERGAFKEFVPNYDISTNEGLPQQLDFHVKDGKVTAPIRMVTDNVWSSLTPDAVGHFRQEARKYAKEHGKALSSPQAYNLAKAIAYDELKESGKLSSTVNETPEYTKPSNQEIRLTFTGSPYAPRGGGAGSGAETVDYYTPIKKWAESVKEGHGAALSNLPTASQSIILKQARDITGRSGIGQKDIYIKKESDGSIVIKDTKTRNIIAPIDFGGVNILGNTPLGVKSKQEIAAKVNKGDGPEAILNSGKKKKMVTMEVDGKTGQIPEDQVDAFLKKHPNAKRK